MKSFFFKFIVKKKNIFSLPSPSDTYIVRNIDTAYSLIYKIVLKMNCF